MSQAPSYILAPNFTFTLDDNDPDSEKWLGNIIPDPFQPRRILDRLTPPLPKTAITTILETSNKYTRTKGFTLSTYLFANFLQTASVDTGLDITKDKTTTYTMSELETRYLKRDPTDDEVTARVEANPRIKTVMDSGILGRKPVYMITGLKIAKNFEFSRSSSTDRSGHVGGSAPITPDASVSLGGSVGGGRKHGEEDGFKSTRDIIFAYQLHVITTRGWREKKRIEGDVFRSKAAFLGQDSQGAEEEEMETNEAGGDDLRAFLEQEIEEGEVRVLEGRVGEDEGGERFVCFYAVPSEDE